MVYQVEIRELGYAPEPYVIADAHMFADGQHIVMFRNLSLKMTGITRREIETFWQNRLLRPATDTFSRQATDDKESLPQPSGIRHPASGDCPSSQPAGRDGCFEHEQILALSVGKPSDAFGETFRAFDRTVFWQDCPGRHTCLSIASSIRSRRPLS